MFHCSLSFLMRSETGKESVDVEEFLIFWIFFNILEVLYLGENGCAPQQNSLALMELYTCSTWKKNKWISWCQLLKKRGMQSKWIMTSIQPPGWRWRGRSQWRWRWRRRQCCGWRSHRCCHLPPRKPLMPFKGQERRKLAGFYDGFNSALVSNFNQSLKRKLTFFCGFWFHHRSFNVSSFLWFNNFKILKIANGYCPL